MKSLITAAFFLAISLTAQAKVTTSISGEEALRLALNSEKVAEAVESIGRANLVEVIFEETQNAGDIKDYRHKVHMRYARYSVKAPCWVIAEIGLKVVKHKKTGVVYSEPVLLSVNPICAM